MGFFSKIVKGIKKVVKKIGKGIKSVFKKVGKFMGKIGFVGQLALGLIMPYALPALGGALGGFATSLMNTAGSGVFSSIARGAGQFLNAAVKVGTRVGQVFKSVTQAVTKTIGQMVGATVNQIPGAGDLIKGLTGNRLDITQMDFSKAWKATQDAWSTAGDSLTNLFSKSTIDSSLNSFSADKLEAINQATADTAYENVTDETQKKLMRGEYKFDPKTQSIVERTQLEKLQKGDIYTTDKTGNIVYTQDSLLANKAAEKATEGTLMSKAEEVGSKIGDELGVKDVTLAGAAELLSPQEQQVEGGIAPLTDYVDYSSLAVQPISNMGMGAGLASATPMQFGDYGNSLVNDIMSQNWANIYNGGMWGFPSQMAGLTNFSSSAGQMVSGIGTDPRVA